MKPLPEPSAPSQPCRHLRNNRMYVPALANQDEHLEQAFWCNKTLAALGADDHQVHPCHCQAGRACHEA